MDSDSISDSIKLFKVTNVRGKHYKFAEKLLLDSFPPTEYIVDEERELVKERKANHRLCIILNKRKQNVGCIAFWKLKDFIFVDHLAISREYQSHGYGSKLLNILKARFNLPIVLEVEPPINELNNRRIAFYQRNGFVLWHSDYEQPPYSKALGFYKLCLMCYGDLKEEYDFKRIKEGLYKDVYSYPETTDTSNINFETIVLADKQQA
jgi:ribosomal protein S18 acetylase RimI-like enzyme